MGLVGLGMMGRNHARVLAELDGVDFVAAADLDPRMDTLARGRSFVSELTELLDYDLDACVLAIPTLQHLEAALQLAGAGVATLIEKPLAASVDEARKLVDAFAAAGTPAAVGHIERFNPSILELKRRLALGDGGPVHQIVSRRVGPRPLRVKDVGVVKDLATHDLDLTMHLAGAEYSRIAAQGASLDSGHEDFVAITGRLTDGTVTNHTVNWITPQKERHVALACEQGTWVANTLTGDLTWSERASVRSDWPAVSTMRGPSEGQVTRFGIAKREPLRVELEHFARLVRGEENESVSLQDGMRVVEVSERVLEAVATQQAIER